MAYNKKNCSLGKCGCDFGAKIFGSCNTSQILLDAKKPETLNWTEISVPEILKVPDKKPDIEHIDQVHAKAEITSVKLIETPYHFNSVTYDLAKLDADGKPVFDTAGNVVALETDVLFYLSPLKAIPNAEGTCLTGRKLIVEGNLIQKIVYTADVAVQSVHSAHYEIPFSAFIIPYTKVEGNPVSYTVIDPKDPKKTIVITGYRADELVIDLCEDFCVDAFIEDIYITAMDCRTIFKNVTLFLRAKPTPQCGTL
ncbi:MAG: DUF3794 domain-containing protein [Romboutsia sp.]|uniref:DUF3794 domain-containing protein n=1 Tax=Romboutsia sp. TaxID=1965302 RepID=UPI003F2DAAD6